MLRFQKSFTYRAENLPLGGVCTIVVRILSDRVILEYHEGVYVFLMYVYTVLDLVVLL